MSRATLLVLFAVSASLLFSADAVETVDTDTLLRTYADVFASMKSKTFQQLAANAQPADRIQYKSAADSETGESNYFASSEAARAKHMTNLLEESLARTAADRAGEAAAMAATVDATVREQATMFQVAEASSGMQSLAEHSKSLRRSVEDLSLFHGLAESARQHEKQEETKAKLREIGSEMASILQASNKLELKLKAIDQKVNAFKAKDTPIAAAAATPDASHAGGTASEDQKFAELEKQTQNIMAWFQELKALREKRAKLKAKKEEALNAATILGITPEDIKKELVNSGKKE